MLSVRGWLARSATDIFSIVTPVTLVALRRCLNAETCRGVIEGREVTEPVGLWPLLFA
jgi:hypothetical protein